MCFPNMKSIASHNGLKATTQAWQMLQSGRSALDSCIEGVTLVEDDPQELTVGYGGLPNENGQVELDAAVMDGKTHRAGAVAGMRGIRHAARVARLVMEQTNRVLLVGQGAQEFAVANGFEIEDLLTDQARRMWLYWKRTRSRMDDWVPPEDAGDGDIRVWFEKYFYGEGTPEGALLGKSGTVHCAALDDGGNLACATTTSGHPFKMAGRVGDSPVPGAGLYVDNEVGACGSIGYGEANLENLSSHTVIEQLRMGRSLAESMIEGMDRIVHKAHPEMCDAGGRPRFNLQLFALSKDGDHIGASLWPGKRMAVSDAAGTRLEDCISYFNEQGEPHSLATRRHK